MNVSLRIKSASRLTLVFALGAAMAILSTAYADSSEDDTPSKFGLQALKGDYGFMLEGVAIDSMDNTLVPAVAIGRFSADGQGNLVSGVRTLNTGGDVQDEIFTGTYTVNPDGTGKVTIYVSTLLPDGSSVPVTIETGRFVITQPRRELQLMGTSLKGPAGEDVGLLIVTRGIARKQ